MYCVLLAVFLRVLNEYCLHLDALIPDVIGSLHTVFRMMRLAFQLTIFSLSAVYPVLIGRYDVPFLDCNSILQSAKLLFPKFGPRQQARQVKVCQGSLFQNMSN